MNEPPDEKPSAPTGGRRLAVDVVLRRDPKHAAPGLSAPWTAARSWVLSFFLAFCGASWFAWVELRGHPIAAYVSALPQVAALFGAAATLLGGGDPSLAKNWYQSRATALLRWIDRRARPVCVGLAIVTLLLVYAGSAMRDIDVECPPGCRLGYGHLGAQLSCDEHRDQVWMPLGLEEVVPTFECGIPGGHGEWQPLRRTVRDDEGTREVFSCYEDGARVTTHRSTAALAYIEYGWLESAPERTPAPCDHLPVGLYDYDVVGNTCTWLISLDELTQLFRAALRSDDADAHAHEASHVATRDALLRLTGSACHDCPTEAAHGEADDAADAGISVEDADVDVDAGTLALPQAQAPAPTRPAGAHTRAHAHDPPKPDSCPRPPDPPFSFFAPDGCHGDWGNVVLELVARQVAVPVGLSYRGGNERRCVPSEYRRDGYVHLLLPDGELVFGVTSATPHDVVLVEDVRSTTPPPALGTTCAE